MRADKSLSPFEIRVYRHYRIVHGTRVALAFLLTFLIIRLFTIPESTWPLVTMVVIMGPISFWGTLSSCLRTYWRYGVGFDFRSYRSATGVNFVTADVSLVRGGDVSLRLAGAGQETVSRIIDWGDAGNCCGFPTGEIDTALWRSGDVILGSLLAMLFTGIWPQRAFIHWRIQLAKSLTEYNRVYQSAFSPNLLERPRLESHLQKLLTDAVKMRGLIAPASKETRIPKSIYEGIQTINRNLVCMLELQINAYWATRPSHFVLLNAQKLRDTQHMMQQILLSLVHALYEGNPQPVFANTEKLNDAVEELRQLLDNHHDLKVVETPIYGYVWLNMETAHQLELLSNLICRALRK